MTECKIKWIAGINPAMTGKRRKMEQGESIFVSGVAGERKKFGKGVMFAIVVAALALVVSAGSGALILMMFVDRGNETVADGSGDGNNYDGNSMNFAEGSIAEMVSKVAPAVVSVLVKANARGALGQLQVDSGAGTGMIVTADGFVLTNKHVVAGAKLVTVVTDAGDTYEDVEVVGVDPLNDVAFLKIPGVKDLPTVKLGDSKTITVGQQVVTIGNALGQYANTISAGIVSGTGRSITASDSSGTGTETLIDMIQTDAAINLGNSGGPLVNAAGEVIGINTAVSTDAQGIGFAIPISSTKGMMRRIVAGGSAERAWLGVNYLAITPAVAKEFDLPVRSGAYVHREGSQSAVVQGGPAEVAGVKDGDIIVAVNGVKVGAKGSISSLIGEYMVGEVVELSLLRLGKEAQLKVKLGAFAE